MATRSKISGKCGTGLPHPAIQRVNQDISAPEPSNLNDQVVGTVEIPNSVRTGKVGKPATGQNRIDGGAFSDRDNEEEFWLISGWTMFEGSRVPHSRDYMNTFKVPWSIIQRNNSCVFTAINQYFGEPIFNSLEDVYEQNKDILGEYRHGLLIDFKCLKLFVF
jgi:hypothetical protein